MKPRFAWLYAAAWLGFYALYSVMLLSTPNTSFLESQSAAFFTVVPAALMGIVVWRWSARLEWKKGQQLRFFVIHFIAAVIYALVWAGITAVQILWFAPRDTFAGYMERAFGWQAFMGLMMYSLIAGIRYVVQITQNLAEQKTLAARAELQALRSQLNPHFLFNTLHSITSLVQQNPAAAENALVKFGSLLRYVLDSSRRNGDDATLEEELTFVRGYLAIEKMRLGNRLTVLEEIDAEALECTLPVLTLQPIVENAVEHGIVPRANGGTVSIRAAMTDSRLSLVIRDDGVGADVKEIASSNGFGLSLVERRLRARFPDTSSLDIDTSPEKGTAVTISVPAT